MIRHTVYMTDEGIYDSSFVEGYGVNEEDEKVIYAKTFTDYILGLRSAVQLGEQLGQGVVSLYETLEVEEYA